MCGKYINALTLCSYDNNINIWMLQSQQLFSIINAQSDILYILTTSSIPGHDPVAILAQSWRFRSE